ncbi:hypothetical protein BB561_006080 [Smittium simulii]|uniref:PH domain-containing protein n=1 Tax=Smittium simulii TaxID=133385 RepID=A0A2T9Y6N3_9FUNG|nr:hypothetical protein BB561_006080 [Smittium simulii]
MNSKYSSSSKSSLNDSYSCVMEQVLQKYGQRDRSCEEITQRDRPYEAIGQRDRPYETITQRDRPYETITQRDRPCEAIGQKIESYESSRTKIGVNIIGLKANSKLILQETDTASISTSNPFTTETVDSKKSEEYIINSIGIKEAKNSELVQIGKSNNHLQRMQDIKQEYVDGRKSSIEYQQNSYSNQHYLSFDSYELKGGRVNESEATSSRSYNNSNDNSKGNGNSNSKGIGNSNGNSNSKGNINSNSKGNINGNSGRAEMIYSEYTKIIKSAEKADSMTIKSKTGQISIRGQTKSLYYGQTQSNKTEDLRRSRARARLCKSELSRPVKSRGAAQILTINGSILDKIASIDRKSKSTDTGVMLRNKEIIKAGSVGNSQRNIKSRADHRVYIKSMDEQKLRDSLNQLITRFSVAEPDVDLGLQTDLFEQYISTISVHRDVGSIIKPDKESAKTTNFDIKQNKSKRINISDEQSNSQHKSRDNGVLRDVTDNITNNPQTEAIKTHSAQTQIQRIGKKAVSGNNRVVSAQNRVVSAQNRETSAQNRETSGQNRETSGQNRVVSSHNRETSVQNRVVSSQNRVVSGQTRVVSSQTRVVSAQTRVVSAHLGILSVGKNKIKNKMQKLRKAARKTIRKTIKEVKIRVGKISAIKEEKVTKSKKEENYSIEFQYGTNVLEDIRSSKNNPDQQLQNKSISSKISLQNSSVFLRKVRACKLYHEMSRGYPRLNPRNSRHNSITAQNTLKLCKPNIATKLGHPRAGNTQDTSRDRGVNSQYTSRDRGVNSQDTSRDRGVNSQDTSRDRGDNSQYTSRDRGVNSQDTSRDRTRNTQYNNRDRGINRKNTSRAFNFDSICKQVAIIGKTQPLQRVKSTPKSRSVYTKHSIIKVADIMDTIEYMYPLVPTSFQSRKNKPKNGYRAKLNPKNKPFNIKPQPKPPKALKSTQAESSVASSRLKEEYCKESYNISKDLYSSSNDVYHISYYNDKDEHDGSKEYKDGYNGIKEYKDGYNGIKEYKDGYNGIKEYKDGYNGIKEYKDGYNGIKEYKDGYNGIKEYKDGYNGIKEYKDGYNGIKEYKDGYNGIKEYKDGYNGIKEYKDGYNGIKEFSGRPSDNIDTRFSGRPSDNIDTRFSGRPSDNIDTRFSGRPSDNIDTDTRLDPRFKRYSTVIEGWVSRKERFLGIKRLKRYYCKLDKQGMLTLYQNDRAKSALADFYVRKYHIEQINIQQNTNKRNQKKGQKSPTFPEHTAGRRWAKWLGKRQDSLWGIRLIKNRISLINPAQLFSIENAGSDGLNLCQTVASNCPKKTLKDFNSANCSQNRSLYRSKNKIDLFFDSQTQMQNWAKTLTKATIFCCSQPSSFAISTISLRTAAQMLKQRVYKRGSIANKHSPLNKTPFSRLPNYYRLSRSYLLNSLSQISSSSSHK